MKERKVKTDRVVNNFINPETGELLDTQEEVKHQKIIVDDSSIFAIVYSEVIGALNTLGKNDLYIIQFCVLNAQINENTIHLTKPVCEKYELALCVPYLNRPVMPFEIDETLPHFRHFEIINHIK